MPTEIGWTDETWNPSTGCDRISPGCDHCYIERTLPFRRDHRRFDEHGKMGVQLHPDRLLMTVPVRALHAGRRGRGVELNGDYWRDGVRYLQAEELIAGSPTLFDLIDAEASGFADRPA